MGWIICLFRGRHSWDQYYGSTLKCRVCYVTRW